MSYPKANLGAIVLPCDTDGPLTFEEYKEKFGIDLLEFFYIEGDNVYPLEGVTKPLYFLSATNRILPFNYNKESVGDNVLDIYGGVIISTDDDGVVVDGGWGLVFTDGLSVENWEY